MATKTKVDLETVSNEYGVKTEVGRTLPGTPDGGVFTFRMTQDVGALESGYNVRNLHDRCSAAVMSFAGIVGRGVDAGGHPSLDILPPFRQVSSPDAKGMRTRVEITIRVYNENEE